MMEPEGVVVHDHDGDVFVHTTVWRVIWHDGRERELVLRVARGVVRDAAPSHAGAVGDQ